MIVRLCEYDRSSSFVSTTVATLKEMCRSRSLLMTGLKYQLVLRVLAHDTLKVCVGNNNRLRAGDIYDRMEETIEAGRNACYWLEKTITDIYRGTQQNNGLDARSKYPYVDDYQFALAAFRDAETAFSVLINFCTPNAGTEYQRSLSSAIRRLGYLVVEARVFMTKVEKKAAINWILELENFLSEFMLDETSKKPLNELLRLLENDAYHLPESALESTKQCDAPATRAPLRCLRNDGNKGSDESIVMAATGAMKKPKAKLVTNKKEIVYRKMAGILRKRSVDSNFVYSWLLRLLKSIARQNNYYEALELFRSAFMALITHFENIRDPKVDSEHNFTISIELLGDVLEEVMEVISTREKKETIRWMTDLQTLTRPHCLGEIAEVPLGDLIGMLKNSIPSQEQATRRFFFS